MKPGWRWGVVAATVVAAALAASAWHKQRAAQQSGTAASPSREGVKTGPDATKPGPGTSPARPARDRPERERADRP